MSLLSPGVYLGGLTEAGSVEWLETHNVRGLVSCCIDDELEQPLPPHIQRILLPIEDMGTEPLLAKMNMVIEFIQEQASAGYNTLIHCKSGISRSPAIAIAYFMNVTSQSLYDVFHFVRSRRPCISPNPGFMAQLCVYEESVKKAERSLCLRKYVSWYTTQGFTTQGYTATPSLTPN
ncbi:dual specificity protein phosphatase [Gregarina niphandrodes]|uniref:protein-tyrosine-phosphatase n=1 Tax=Gregarina niphandrodes TaxID=110365 RepID=A0A023AXP0_GRENI|nr:dual specificity protein phosphatase [Gregarina niphandrodes]EZG43411.1 dual specificity protein phosphatase [Gregarina niphandrodes]|eukprot:XP_011133352.1 dual specificity protein phosphatase [Gregarina niphandrodes]